jgi:ribose 5-phosphate isomerase B
MERQAMPIGAAGAVERDIAVCGSGVRASIAANKVRGVRAGLIQKQPSQTLRVAHEPQERVQ